MDMEVGFNLKKLHNVNIMKKICKKMENSFVGFNPIVGIHKLEFQIWIKMESLFKLYQRSRSCLVIGLNQRIPWIYVELVRLAIKVFSKKIAR